ncbi:hypothetical protein RQP46_007194 [Phenoliferia psychrophenolica]
MSHRASLESGTVTVADSDLRALISSLSPLLFDERTHEPYLPFPSSSPFANFRLTPPRLSDLSNKVSAANSPSIQPFLSSTPVPVTETWAEQVILTDQKTILAILLAWTATDPPGGTTFRILRQIVDESDRKQDVYAGEIAFVREKWFQLEARDDEVERARLQALNNAKLAGDRTISWTVGFYIVQAFAGRGLMTATLETAMDFGKTVLNVHKIVSGAFMENEASKRVHYKLGFTSPGSDWVDLPPGRAELFGKRKEVCVLEWRRE